MCELWVFKKRKEKRKRGAIRLESDKIRQREK